MPDFWSGRAALVTGGAGFLGSHLVRRLVSLGARVRVVDDLSHGTAPRQNDVEFRKQDVRDPAVCEEACRGIDVVFHLAGRVGGIGYYLTRPGEVLRDNLLIDAHMLGAALATGVSRYFYASTAHVYPRFRQTVPNAPALGEDEAVPADPPVSYGWAKLLGERAIIDALTDGTPMRAAIFRLIGVYGEGQDVDLDRGSAIPVLVRRAIEYPRLAPFVVRGTGEETRSYSYVGDVVDAILAGVEALQDAPLVGPLNVGSEESIRIAELADLIRQVSGKLFDIVFDPSVPTHIWGQRVDCSRARTILGWAPQVPLEIGLRRVFADVQGRTS